MYLVTVQAAAVMHVHDTGMLYKQVPWGFCDVPYYYCIVVL
jgi:hypothetical protein